MCYTVQKWTKVCPQKHCMGSQICWRQCIRTRNFVTPWGEKDYYTLCDERDQDRLFPLICDPNIYKKDCDVCKLIGYRVHRSEIIIRGDDITVRELEQQIDDAKLRLESIKGEREDLQKKILERKADLLDRKVPPKSDLELCSWQNRLKRYIPGDISRLKQQIPTLEGELIQRKKQIEETQKRLMHGRTYVAFTQAEDWIHWKWRCYSYPTLEEIAAFPNEFLPVEDLPDGTYLEKPYKTPYKTCNWEESPLHKLPE